MVDEKEGHPGPIFVTGKNRPKKKPPGFIWVPIRGLDPTKDPRSISGHELRRITITPQGEFALPPEKEHLRGQLVEQEDFLDKVGPVDPQGSIRESDPGDAASETKNIDPAGLMPRALPGKGDYTAEEDAQEMERTEFRSEHNMRKAQGLPVNEEQ